MSTVLAAAIGVPELVVILLNLAILGLVGYVAVVLVRRLGRGADARRVADLEETVADLERRIEE